jgi:hypothetical protein
MTEDANRGKFIVDELFQLNRSLNQTADRTERWEEGGLTHLPPGTAQHFSWLRHLFSTRIRLAQEADFYSDLMAINVYFSTDKRNTFQAIGLDEALCRFFRIKSRPPMSKIA